MVQGVRFGVTVAPGPSATKWRDRVRALDDSPFDVLLVNDHLSGLRFAPIAALTAASELTSRLRLGTLVLANDYRHPAILAKEVATLDLLSGGRLELGIGTGWMRSDYDQTGLTFDLPKIRLARLREAVDILRGACGDTPFSYDGEHYRARALDLDPRPVQRPHPPLLMGGGGPVMLRFAARQADIVNITTRTGGRREGGRSERCRPACAADEVGAGAGGGRGSAVEAPGDLGRCAGRGDQPVDRHRSSGGGCVHR